MKNFTCILILYGLSRKNLVEFLKNVSWKSGNWLGWSFRHPGQGLTETCLDLGLHTVYFGQLIQFIVLCMQERC